MTTEYIYFDDEGNMTYTSRNHPLKYEDQTDMLVVSTENDRDMDRLLDLLGLVK